MIEITPTSRQPQRQPWTIERLVHERSIALGLSIDTSSSITYTSALNSYLTFCKIHSFPIEPTEETLSFFTVFMSTHIKPDSVNSYLSGICNQLEPFFPEIRKRRNSMLVSRTLQGCMRRFGTPIKRKRPLSTTDIDAVFTSLRANPSHDNTLFMAMLTTGFYGLLRLGEMTFPDSVKLRNYRKVTMRRSVSVTDSHFSFFLPGHKADRFFEGNTIIIQKLTRTSDPHITFINYLHSRDRLFPLHPELWLRTGGIVPTRSWFIKRLRLIFPKDIAGQSLRAGGATSLAEAGVLPAVIQATGRWASATFQIYIRKNPVLLQALIYGRPAHEPRPADQPAAPHPQNL